MFARPQRRGMAVTILGIERKVLRHIAGHRFNKKYCVTSRKENDVSGAYVKGDSAKSYLEEENFFSTLTRKRDVESCVWPCSSADYVVIIIASGVIFLNRSTHRDISSKFSAYDVGGRDAHATPAVRERPRVPFQTTKV